jgi:sterol desaturase/sphingolipid hydroxylase (fatty acid hydroxylase superfamily)
MMTSWLHSSMIEIPLFALAIAGTHLVMSFGQTLMHYYLGHTRLGGKMFRNHINFHHTYYARGHLTSRASEANDGNNTPYFFIPVGLAAAVMYFLLPIGLFVAVMLTAGISFYVHVWFDKAYHIEGSCLERFAWFRRMRQRHFVHHLHANRNFAVIDFFWDRLLGTFRDVDQP